MDSSSRPAKKSKFSVTPLSPGDTSNSMSSSGISIQLESLISKKSTESKGIESLLNGLEEIKEDVIESRSDVNLAEVDCNEMAKVPDHVLDNEEQNNKQRGWKSSYRESRLKGSSTRPSESCSDYFNKENFRKSHWTSSPQTSRISTYHPVRPSTILPSGQDVYELFRSMQTKLQNLKDVIQKQKVRLHTPSPQLSPITRQSRFTHMHTSRSDYLRRADSIRRS